MATTPTGTKPKAHQKSENCDDAIQNTFRLEEQQTVHKNSKPFSCNLCDYSAAEKHNLKRHICCHLKEKQFKCSEPNCNYSSSERGNVNTHHKIVHLGEKRFQCPICPHKCGFKTNLARHMKTHEENQDRTFKCKLCPFKTTDKDNLKSHMTFIHSEERDFMCPQDGCNYAAKAKHHLTRHLQIHREKTLSCPHSNCEYKSNSTDALKSHLNAHKLNKKHKCRLCDFATHVRRNLTVHVRTHTLETPFKCKFPGCQYQAKASCTLNKHVKRNHEKNQPFKCGFFGCSFAASHQSRLRRHQISQHCDSLKSQIRIKVTQNICKL